jgi:hypothetical protein
MVRSGPVEIIVRGQSYGWRLPKYCPPIPLTAQRKCTPRLWCGGRTHLPGGEGGVGSIFWKTSDTALYSTYVSTLMVQISQKDSYLRNHTHWGRPLYANDEDFVVFSMSVCRGRVWSKKSASRISAELLQREKKAQNFYIQMDIVSFSHKFFVNGVILSTNQYIGENFEFFAQHCNIFLLQQKNFWPS